MPMLPKLPKIPRLSEILKDNNPTREIIDDARDVIQTGRQQISSVASALRLEGTQVSQPAQVAPIEEAPEATLALDDATIQGGTAGIACVPPDSLVIALPEPKPIAEVSVGDMVLDAYGADTEVVKVYRRHFDGEIVIIQPWYRNLPLKLTQEHPLLTTHYPTLLKQFVRALDIAKGDLLTLPKLEETTDCPSISISNGVSIEYESGGDNLIVPKRVGGKPVAVKDIISIDANFMELVGLYLAEGSINNSRLYLSFGKHEGELVERATYLLKEVLGVAPIVRSQNTAITVNIWSVLVAQFFNNLFRYGAAKKCIPHWMMTLPRSKQKALLKGFWRGDGYQAARANKLAATTTSRSLALQLEIILHRLGVIDALWISKPRNGLVGNRVINGRHPAYDISVYGHPAMNMAAFMDYDQKGLSWPLKSHQKGLNDNDHILVPVKKVSRQHYVGEVMNLETQSGTYTIMGFGVHNCSLEHISDVAASDIAEALRMARSRGIKDGEVRTRLVKARQELNQLERYDLTAEKIVNSPKEEQELARAVLPRSSAMRHAINDILMRDKDIEDLEKLAAYANNTSQQITDLVDALPAEQKASDECLQVKRLNPFLEERKVGK